MTESVAVTVAETESVTVAVTVAVAVAVAVAEGTVLVIPVQALTPHHHTTKGLDAPLMAPMTSRTGPRGRSETTFLSGSSYVPLR